MSEHTLHTQHSHAHGPGCGHVAIKHNGHTDYAHDGHLHRPHEGHVDECAIAVDASNPASCTPSHACGGHPQGHAHGPGCGHEAIPHGDHVDYLVAGHLHHPHGGHCDHHGEVRSA
jgi:hypothetical protein